MHTNIDALLTVRNRFKLMLSKNELKFIKSLKIKKYRLREKRFLVEGAKNVLELVNSNFSIDLILSTKVFAENNPTIMKFGRLEIVSEKELASAGNFVSNKDCLAVVHTVENDLSSLNMSKLIFMLDGINDPGNLGTIIRTLDWFGFDQVVCSKDTAELFNPKTISSTMGAFTRVKVWYEDLIQVLSQNELPTYAAEMNGKNLFKTKLQNPSIIIMGNESNGISASLKPKIRESITIPRHGQAESLNVGVATGIIAGYLRMS